MVQQLIARLTTCVVALFALAWAPATFAYEVFPSVPGEYAKWGASNAAGTGEGVVTWGFMAASTSGSAYCGDA